MFQNSLFIGKVIIACIISIGGLFLAINEVASSISDCPVTPYNEISIDEEFGDGAGAITHCLKHREKAKVVILIDHTFPLSPLGKAKRHKATFLSNMDIMIRNYEVVHGMQIGKDVDIVVVAASSGAALMTTEHRIFGENSLGDPLANPFVEQVELGLKNNIQFFVCQAASRALGINMDNKIPGVNFVPGGHIAVADFQLDGYVLIRP